MDATPAQLTLRDRRIVYAVTDRELKLVGAGGALEMLPGHGTTLRGQSLLDLVPELRGVANALTDLLHGRLPSLGLGWVRRQEPDGPACYLSTATFPHRDRRGRITGVIHLMHDVTEMGSIAQKLAANRSELQRLQERLSRRNLELAIAQNDLQRLVDVQSQFVSVAAHELAKPLTPIRGYVEMLLDGDFGPLTDEQRHRLELVENSLDRLQRLTSDLLDVMSFEANGIAPDLGPTDLAALVRDVVGHFEPQLKEKSQSVALSMPPALPFARVDGDGAARVIGNLLSNAHLYTPPGGHIDVTLTLAESDGHLQVSVADDGVGIAARDQRELFTRFFRGESAAQAGVIGTGLGLYIARSLVELRGGRIWCDSEPGRGSTFYVTFPIADVDV